MKRLYRNPEEGKLLGVCSGLGDHFDIDPVIFRVLFITLFIFFGIGFLPYLILALITPKDPRFK